jgi:uncharacterized protein
MKTEEFRYRTRIEASAEEVFRWHTRPGALERLTPPWEHVEVIERTGGINNGDRVVLRMHLGPLSQTWVAEHRDYLEGRQFRDVQREGPFAHWEHTHRFEPDGANACYLEDRIEYALPFGALGERAGGKFVQRKLEKLFRYRHQVTATDVLAHTRYDQKPLKILLSGASGLVGSALLPFLTAGGHQIIRLVRGQPRPEAPEVQWDPVRGVLDLTRIEGVDAVVHLAGENIAAGRWTPERKARIRESRVRGTKTLSEALGQLVLPPKVFVSASAMGYYGDRGSEVVHEDSPPGQNFLADVCTAWEAATDVAEKKGIRVAHLRIGLVLSGTGGALAKMLVPFKLGAGGSIGSGKQYMSWVALDDMVGIIHHVLMTETLRGAVNAVTPNPVTNSEFTRTLGAVLHRPTLLPVPAFALRLALGREMADDLLLSSTRLQPRRLIETAYPFRHPDLRDALRYVLGKT